MTTQEEFFVCFEQSIDEHRKGPPVVLMSSKHLPSTQALPAKTALPMESIEVHAICVIVHILGSALEMHRIMLMCDVVCTTSTRVEMQLILCNLAVVWVTREVQALHDIRRLILRTYEPAPLFMQSDQW
jgi:hypothetical protein